MQVVVDVSSCEQRAEADVQPEGKWPPGAPTAHPGLPLQDLLHLQGQDWSKVRSLIAAVVLLLLLAKRTILCQISFHPQDQDWSKVRSLVTVVLLLSVLRSSTTLFQSYFCPQGLDWTEFEMFRSLMLLVHRDHKDLHYRANTNVLMPGSRM